MGSEKAQETGLAGRYATAIFELSQDEKAIDAVAADFALLKARPEESADLAQAGALPCFFP